MREIKFRVFTEVRHEVLGMKYFDLKDTSESNNTVMQYTGLKDKNGKEIFEGDIFEQPYNETYDFARYSIYWREEQAQFWTDCLALHHKETGYKDISRGGYCTGGISQKKMEELEIIGNIYEHPELLK